MQTRIQTIGLVAALLVAVSPAHAAAAAKAALPGVPAGQAQLVVMRSTTVNALVGTHLYDVTSGEPKLLGKVTNSRKVAVTLAPGDHVLMVGNFPIFEFMQATVAADKRYYAVIAPIWPAQWFLRPVRKQNATFLLSSKEVASLVKKTKYVALEPDEVSADKAAKILEAYKERWPKWQAKDAAEKDMLTLHADDSVN